jgi:nucleoside-diphosphate-sugar epimerase
MRVLITGTEGYIGCLLGPVLRKRGHEITGLDTGFYTDGWLEAMPDCRFFPRIRKDIRHITTEDLKGFQAVVHLAELSNDPLGQLRPNITYDINHAGTVALAQKCKQAGIARLVYTSSCSVYGAGSEGFVTEDSATNPQTAYGKCKVMVERDLSPMADASFTPIFLRNATAFGPSPRMRFDIVLNNLSGLAWTIGEIRMTSDGSPWRPLVHVLDICDAIACVLEAPTSVVHNQIFNVGNTEHNYRVKEIAEIVARVFPGCKLTFGSEDPDNRSYRVSFEKIKTQLGLDCKRDALSGASQLRELFEALKMPAAVFQFRAFTRLKQIEYLINTGQVDNSLFWSAGTPVK